MSTFKIYGGNELNGEITIDACKNSILPIIAGSILCNGIVKIKNCCFYSDVEKMCTILQTLGSKIEYSNKELILNNKNLSYAFIPNNLTKDIRASIFTLGPMLARFGKAKISMPGGCLIGSRGIEIHKELLENLGVKFVEKHGYIQCEYSKLFPQELYLKFPSVGATENIIMFACANYGTYKIHNVAKEPEIVDLVNFLNKMGANIVGAGTNCIEIVGTKNFKSIEYTPIPDRIMAGTMMIACAMTKGKIKLQNCNSQHLTLLINILKQAGCKIKNTKNYVEILSNKRLKNFGRVDTNPYPSFPTDLQSQLTTMATICNGVSLVKENIFETRFKFVPELIKMGANIQVENNLATIIGVENIYGADVFSTDLRGGVSLVLAGLVAKGYTTVYNVELIDRGYYKLEEKLAKLGAKIERL